MGLKMSELLQTAGQQDAYHPSLVILEPETQYKYLSYISLQESLPFCQYNENLKTERVVLCFGGILLIVVNF